MKKKDLSNKVKWKKVKLTGKKFNKTGKKPVIHKTFKTLRRLPKKIRITSVKSVLKSGHFKVLTLFLFSLFIFLFSVVDFEKDKALSPSVKGLSNYKSVNYVPSNSQMISKEMTDGDLMLKYSTNLSPDQISSFYNKLAVLNGWKQINQNTYECSKGEFSYRVMQENNQNIVEYSLCESAR